MKDFIIKGGNGKYTAEVVYESAGGDDVFENRFVLWNDTEFEEDEDEDVFEKEDTKQEPKIWRTSSHTKKAFIVEANGEIKYPPYSSFEEIEEKYDDCVIDALKNKGYFSSIEDDPNADKDDDEYIIKVFALDI